MRRRPHPRIARSGLRGRGPPHRPVPRHLARPHFSADAFRLRQPRLCRLEKRPRRARRSAFRQGPLAAAARIGARLLRIRRRRLALRRARRRGTQRRWLLHRGFPDEQLAFLKTELAAAGGRPVALCGHIPSVSVFPTVAGLAKLVGAKMETASSLVASNTKAMLDTVKEARGNLKLVLAGHLHHYEQVDLDGVRYINSGAVCGNWWKGAQAVAPKVFWWSISSRTARSPTPTSPTAGTRRPVKKPERRRRSSKLSSNWLRAGRPPSSGATLKRTPGPEQAHRAAPASPPAFRKQPPVVRKVGLRRQAFHGRVAEVGELDLHEKLVDPPRAAVLLRLGARSSSSSAKSASRRLAQASSVSSG